MSIGNRLCVLGDQGHRSGRIEMRYYFQFIIILSTVFLCIMYIQNTVDYHVIFD